MIVAYVKFGYGFYYTFVGFRTLEWFKLGGHGTLLVWSLGDYQGDLTCEKCQCLHAL